MAGRKNPYLEHFGLQRSPFSTTPDPAFSFATREHKAALAKIAYYTEERRGIFLITGEIGSGKTTLSQFALNGWLSPTTTSPPISPTRPRAPRRPSCGSYCPPSD